MIFFNSAQSRRQKCETKVKETFTDNNLFSGMNGRRVPTDPPEYTSTELSQRIKSYGTVILTSITERINSPGKRGESGRWKPDMGW